MRRAVTILALLGCLVVATPAWADAPYTVDLKVTGGSDNKKLARDLEQASQLVALKDKPPASTAALRRRADQDMPRLVQAMQALGYWRAAARFSLTQNDKSAKLAVTVETGPLFHYGAMAFLLPDGTPAALMTKLGAATRLGLAPGAVALSRPVADANAGIVNLYARNGYPFAKVTARKATVNVASATLAAIYTIEAGDTARFGATAVTGLKRVEESFVRRHIAWRAGDPYDAEKVAETRQALVRTGLFSGIEVNHAPTPDAEGRVAMTLALVEGPPRTIGAGAGYNTNLGFGTQAFWENRNLFGNGEDLRLSAGVAQKQVGVAATFRRPDFIIPKQDLIVSGEILRQTTDAYQSRRGVAYVGLEELMFSPDTFGAGISLERAYLSHTDPDENYLLFGIPFYLRRDTTDDLLDPTRGTRTTFTLTPYHGLFQKDFNFVSTRAELKAYRQIGGDDRMVLAGYGALGTVLGESLAGLPPDKRLYAGGSGSVRGFAYQRAGPLDMYDIPVGGRSSLEMGAEFRYRLSQDFGIVPFIDAGNVYDSVEPRNLSLFYSAGLGLRYYTAIGPIRLDLAFPIHKRPSDGPVQVYISLGQAF